MRRHVLATFGVMAHTVMLLSCVPAWDEAAVILPHAPPAAAGEPVFAMRVGRPLEVAVRVTDTDGLPVRGVKVWWSSTVDGFPTEIAPEPATSTTDADGIATTTFSSSQAISLVVTTRVNDRLRTVFLAEFVDPIPVAIVPDGAPVGMGGTSFTAEAGSTLEVAVRVLDAAGIGVEGVAVDWSTLKDWYPYQIPSTVPTWSVTDADGRATTTVTSPLGVSFMVGALANNLWNTFRVQFLTGPAVAFANVADCVGGAPGSRPLHPINFTLLDAEGRPTADEVTLTVLDGGGYLSKPGTTELRVKTSPLGRVLEGSGLVQREERYFRFGEHYWVLGPELGVQRAKATLANGQEQIFTAEARAPYVAFRDPSPTVDSAGNVEVKVDICQADSAQPRTLTIGGVVRTLRQSALDSGVYDANQACLFVGRASGTDLTYPVTVTVSAEDTGGVSASISAELTR